MNKLTKNTDNYDIRSRITKGPHYETIPERDFGIYNKREIIRVLMLENYFKNAMMTSFTVKDLEQLYYLYDKYSFNNELQKMLLQKGHRITFSINLKSKIKAGTHCYSNGIHTITINPTLIKSLFNNGETTIKANGLKINDRLEALMNVFEHEIIHLYCSLKGYTRKVKMGQGKRYYGPHGKLYQELVFSFFGHTEFRHCFGLGDMSIQLTKEKTHVGMSVFFNDKNGKIYGKVIKCNPKNAQVNIGNKQIYNVPYEILRESEEEVDIEEVIENVDDIKKQCYIGMNVKFNNGKKGDIEGVIIKCNPKKAKIQTRDSLYSVPYQILQLK